MAQHESNAPNGDASQKEILLETVTFYRESVMRICFTDRLLFSIFATVLNLLLLGILPVSALAPPAAVHLEAEDGTLDGVTVATEAKSYSGRGYVTGFTHDGAQVTLTFDAVAGLYTVRLRYRAANGEKQCDIRINGSRISNRLAGTAADVFATADFGKVDLKDGKNTLIVEKGWGWYDIDAVDLVPTQPFPVPRHPPKQLSDRQATPATRVLFNHLVDLYGVQTLSGQINTEDIDYTHSVTGKYPAIFGWDLMDFSGTRLSHGTTPEPYFDRFLQTVRERKRLLTLMWHWNAPANLLDTPEHRWWSGFYTNASTFDIEYTLNHPDSEQYRLLLADMDRIAAQLHKAAAANMPVLWRPLHEAEGRWFWWGAKGPEPFKRLWRLMYDRFTRHQGLHNLIWVYSSGTDPAWYPGDDCVDIVGIDAYPADYTDPLTGTYETLQKRFEGRKLLALTEFGKVPDITRMRRFGVYWSYFVPWTGNLGPQGLPKAELIRLYSAPSILNQLSGH